MPGGFGSVARVEEREERAVGEVLEDDADARWGVPGSTVEGDEVGVWLDAGPEEEFGADGLKDGAVDGLARPEFDRDGGGGEGHEVDLAGGAGAEEADGG